MTKTKKSQLKDIDSASITIEYGQHSRSHGYGFARLSLKGAPWDSAGEMADTLVSFEFQANRLDVPDLLLNSRPLSERDVADPQFDVNLPHSGFYGGHAESRDFSLDGAGVQRLTRVAKWISKIRETISEYNLDKAHPTCELAQIKAALEKLNVKVTVRFFLNGREYGERHIDPSADNEWGVARDYVASKTNKESANG